MIMQTAVSERTTDPYYSRVTETWEAAERVDPVVWDHSAPGPLSSEQVDQFERDGFLFLPDLFSQGEVSQFLGHAEELARNWPEESPGLVREPESQAVRSIFRLHAVSDTFQKVFSDPRLVGPVQQILASDLYVHQSRINYKPAMDGKEFFWHSDFETWHVEDGMPAMRTISVSVFLTESNEFNGPLMLVPGSHKTFIRCVGETPENHHEQSLKRQQIGVPSRDALAKLVDDGGIVAPKGAAGSVVMFDCNTMHGSAGNLSPSPRSNLFAVYNSVHNELGKPFGASEPRPDFLAERNVKTVE